MTTNAATIAQNVESSLRQPRSVPRAKYIRNSGAASSCQYGEHLMLREELRDCLVEPRHDVSDLHETPGLDMAKESPVTATASPFIAKGQFGDPALAVRERVELADVQQPVAHR